MLEPVDNQNKEQKKDLFSDLKGVFPCPLCNNGLKIKETKNKKPYCICLDCGIQLFIRGKQGIKRLDHYLKNGLSEPLLSPNDLFGSTNSQKAIVILNEMGKIKNKIEELEQNMGFLETMFGNEENEIVIKVLKSDLEKLSAQLREIKGL